MTRNNIHILCPKCASYLNYAGNDVDIQKNWSCSQCDFRTKGTEFYVNLFDCIEATTSEHYSLQWGEQINFFDFIQNRPEMKKITPSEQLGWPKIFAEIRELAEKQSMCVYDAACGWGGIALELITEKTKNQLTYIGADIHSNLASIPSKIQHFQECGKILQWDISNPVPVDTEFDYVLCRASMHITPDPRKTFASLCSKVKKGGKIAVSVYTKKSICRETLDDALQRVISKMPPDEGFEACKEFTILGKALQQIQGKVTIPCELPILGLKRGEYELHYLFYYNFLKCFYNKDFGEEKSTVVNFDYYHPPYLYRYDLEEMKEMFHDNGIRVDFTCSIEAQHYISGTKV